MDASPALVTGATGFVGSAVLRTLLAQGISARALVRRDSDRRNLDGLEVEPVEGDLRDPSGFAAALRGCRSLFHVAADYRIWVPDPEPMLRANVEGTRALLLAAAEAGVERIVYCSSVAALGLTKDGSPADETTPVTEAGIAGIYKKSKYWAEQAVLELARGPGVPVVIVNPAAPVGPRDIKPTPTGRMIIDAACGRMPAYLDTGLDVVHVDDVAEAHWLAFQRGRVGERYILGGENIALHAILDMVDAVVGRPRRRAQLRPDWLWPAAVAAETYARWTGAEPRVTRDHLRMARKKMYFSHAKATAELGYAPRPARAAIEDAVAWFRAHGMLR